MKALPGILLLSLVFGAGCAGVRPQPGQGPHFGYFDLTNNAGASVGMVFWGNQQAATTNDILYALILPETEMLKGGANGRGNNSYLFYDLRIKSTDHHWKIEQSTVSHARLRWVRITDVTSGTATDLDLHLSRYWKGAEHGLFIPLADMDDTITRKIADVSQQHRDWVARSTSDAIKSHRERDSAGLLPATKLLAQ
ncbi:MAG TPA: hypothetical protein VFZ59_05285 [Verrucomicrobiae bacterium]|nr:hypothetical protein [Verrucomicrobiae bacterium]